MCVLGIGIDLIDIRRVEAALKRFGWRFSERVFTDAERTLCTARPRPGNAFAIRYAAKEACAKALGTGFRQGVFWRDIEIAVEPSGKPIMVLHGGARERLRQLTPPQMVPSVEVSLTDEYPYGQAIVVIAAAPVLDGLSGTARL